MINGNGTFGNLENTSHILKTTLQAHFALKITCYYQSNPTTPVNPHELQIHCRNALRKHKQRT